VARGSKKTDPAGDRDPRRQLVQPSTPRGFTIDPTSRGVNRTMSSPDPPSPGPLDPRASTPALPQRILIVSYEYPPLGGDGGVVFRDLAKELARHTRVTVLTSGRR